LGEKGRKNSIFPFLDFPAAEEASTDRTIFADFPGGLFVIATSL
jgi:hypothetical protein